MKVGVHAIIQKIGEDTLLHSEERSSQIKADVDEAINRENALREDEFDKRREMLIKHNEREGERLMERLNGRLHRELVAYRHRLIDEIFDMALNQLRDISQDQFAKIFKAAIRGLEGRFMLHIGELSKGKLNIQEMDEAVKQSGGPEIVVSVEAIPHKSGFVLENEKVEYNCLFEDLIEEKKGEQATAILKEIFG